jgi:hypothetical protein
VRALTYYVGVSLDGFIAAPDGSIDAFPVTEDVMEFIADQYPETLLTHMREQLGITAPGWRFDTVVMGRNSPEPQPHTVPDDPVGLVRHLKRQPGAGVWLAGGGHLGVGIPLSITDQAHLLPFELVDDRTLRSGTTVTTYSAVFRTCSSRA